jgi:hypothetical protein
MHLSLKKIQVLGLAWNKPRGSHVKNEFSYGGTDLIDLDLQDHEIEFL